MVESWQERVRGIVRNELARRGWKLVTDETDLIDRVCTALAMPHTDQGEASRDPAGKPENGNPDTPPGFSPPAELGVTRGTAMAPVPPDLWTPSAIQAATVHCYCKILYEACCATGSIRQQDAFRELEIYLYPQAVYRTRDPDQAQDLTQQTLFKIWKNRSQVRDPGRFLGYARMILCREFLDTINRSGPQIEPLDDGDQGVAGVGDINMTNPEEINQLPLLTRYAAETVVDSDLSSLSSTDRDLVLVIRGCIRNVKTRAVIIGLFVLDLKHREIAQVLAISVNHLHVLRHRGLADLKKCPAFLRYVERKLA